jgi:hypothetical protein
MLCGAVVASVVLGGGATAGPDTSFVYQGELREGGGPADGAYQMAYRLWDALAGGVQIGATIDDPAVTVSEGRFTVELDFGAAAFDNAPRWLELEVEGVVLAPRQAVGRSPYAIQTRGIHVDPDLNVGLGTDTPAHLLDLLDDAPTLRLAATDPTPGVSGHLRFRASPGPAIFHPLGSIDFADDVDALRATISATKSGPTAAQLNFSVSPGAVPQLTLTTSTARIRDGLEVRRGTDLELAASIGSDGADSLFQLQGGNVGIGTDAPMYPLHVVTEEDVLGAIVGRHEGPGTFRVGVYGYSSSSSGAGVYGSGGDETVYGVFGESFRDDNGIGVYGWARGFSGVNYGVIGISSSPSGFDFMAWGNGMDYGSNSSIRWKHHIEPIPHPLDMLAALRGVYFEWDEAHGGQRDVGMIAEEVGAVLPQIVAYEANGVDAIAMDYAKLSPLLVEAVNALREEKDAEIEALRTSLEAVRTENAALRERLIKVERLVEAWDSGERGR